MDIPPSLGNAIYPVSYFLGYRKSHPKDEQDPLLVAKGLRSGGLMRKVEYWAHTLVAAYVGLILVGECEPCDYLLVVPVYSGGSRALERTAERDRADMLLALFFVCCSCVVLVC
jgi:hypothetical protein